MATERRRAIGNGNAPGGTGVLPVTAEVANYLCEQGFEGFSPNTHVVAMPHIMPDVVDWISALIELGIPPANIHVLGKQYSQVETTASQLKQMGVDVVDYTPATPGRYYETLHEQDLPRLWEHAMEGINRAVAAQGHQTVLVMDDGGRVVGSVPPELANNPKIGIVGVEQTTNGYDYIRNEGHQIDVVVPAKSAIKMEFEPPFIADAATHRLREKFGILKNRDVSVLGLGNIGGAISELLADNHNHVFVYDKTIRIEGGQLHDPNHLLPARINIYEAPSPGEGGIESAKLLRASDPRSDANYYVCNNLEQAVQNSRYVFGCTGKDVFQHTDLDQMLLHSPHKTPDETRFISLSSGDREFLSLLKWINGKPDHVHHGEETKMGSRWDVTMHHDGRRVRVLQQGFPINFDGKNCSGTPEEMQLISSFLLASLVQGYEYVHKYPLSAADDVKHLIMLSPAAQRKILETWLENVPGVKELYRPERVAEIMSNPLDFCCQSEGICCPVFKDDFPVPECIASRLSPAAPKMIGHHHG